MVDLICMNLLPIELNVAQPVLNQEAWTISCHNQEDYTRALVAVSYVDGELSENWYAFGSVRFHCLSEAFFQNAESYIIFQITDETDQSPIPLEALHFDLQCDHNWLECLHPDRMESN